MKVKVHNKNVSFTIPDGLKTRSRDERPKRELFIVSKIEDIIDFCKLTHKELYNQYYSIDEKYYVSNSDGEIIGFETDYRCNLCDKIVCKEGMDMWNHLIVEHLFKEEFEGIIRKARNIRNSHEIEEVI
jgi:hypothetical protein